MNKFWFMTETLTRVLKQLLRRAKVSLIDGHRWCCICVNVSAQNDNLIVYSVCCMKQSFPVKNQRRLFVHKFKHTFSNQN